MIELDDLNTVLANLVNFDLGNHSLSDFIERMKKWVNNILWHLDTEDYQECEEYQDLVDWEIIQLGHYIEDFEEEIREIVSSEEYDIMMDMGLVFECEFTELISLNEKKEFISKVFKSISVNFQCGFFTYDTHIKYPFACIPLKYFKESLKEKYPAIIVDCGIEDLLKTPDKEYKFLDNFEGIVKKHGDNNCLFAIPDYPTSILPKNDKDKWQATFLERTVRNNLRFHSLDNTIVSVQYETGNIASFKDYWERLYPLAHNNIAVGNLKKCRNRLFFKEMLNFIILNNPRCYHTHFFGIGKDLIKELFNFVFRMKPKFSITFDTVKWSFTSNSALKKLNNGFIARSKNRQLFFFDFLNFLCKHKELEFFKYRNIRVRKQISLNSFINKPKQRIVRIKE